MKNLLSTLLFIFSRKEDFIYLDGGVYGKNKSNLGYVISHSDGILNYEEKDYLKILNRE